MQSRLMVRWLALAAVGLATLTAAASAADAPSTSAAAADATASAPPSTKDDAYADVKRIIQSYRLGPDDKVKVTVFGEDALTGEYAVGSNGNISMPLIGDVRAAGDTIDQLTTAITRKLADGYLKEPKVSAEVTVYRPFFILGEVNKPGNYPYTSGLTVQNAVATAEGFTYRANTHKVYIKREGEAREHEYPLTAALPVAPGDTIRIGERFF